MKPTFIACTARSGSTLLRWMIDAHPQAMCPAETDIAQLLAPAERSIGALFGPDVPARSLDARNFVEEMVRRRLEEGGKTVWVDKSMSNALNLDLLAKTWLGCNFLFLHRHVMDFIASALKAQPWGLSDYGFSQYAARCPGDDVGALARYWLERTTQMLDFEQRTGHRTLRVRYEHLVSDPHEVLSLVWMLLGVQTPPVPVEGAFEAPHDAYGSADHQIWYTSAVSSGSVGSGARIPPVRLAGDLRQQINEALHRLGYPLIDDGWGAGGPLPRRGEGGVRVVDGHTLIEARELWEDPAVAVVERRAIPDLISGRLNMGAAVRSRQVRYYGPPLSGYGEESRFFGSLPKLLAEMVL